jgi:hypothetical protein
MPKCCCFVKHFTKIPVTCEDTLAFSFMGPPIARNQFAKMSSDVTVLPKLIETDAGQGQTQRAKSTGSFQVLRAAGP